MGAAALLAVRILFFSYLLLPSPTFSNLLQPSPTFSRRRYEFSPASRPLYKTPLTVGYIRGINRAHAALRLAGRAGRPVTLKPFLVLASKGDDVLKGPEVLRLAHAIGPSRTLIELAYARHDVFASAEPELVGAALSHLSAWLVGEGLSSSSFE